MPAPAHVAMMAIAETPDRLQRLAIFIGTKTEPFANPPGPWLVSFADADQAQDWFREKGSGPTGAATVFDVPPPALLSNWLTAVPIGVSDGGGAVLEERMMPASGATAKTRWWIDHVIRLHFFSAGQSWEFGKVPPAPLVRLDTAGFAKDEDGTTLDPDWVVSRLRLDAASAWTDIMTRPRPVELSGYRVVGHIPIAVNAHAPATSAAGRAKQFDTRAVFIAEAGTTQQQGALWKAGTDQSPAFRAISLHLSDVDGLSPALPSPPGGPLGSMPSLSSLIGDDKAYHTASAPAAAAPLFANVADYGAKPPANLIPLRRQFGFRRIAPGKPLVLRSELHLAIADLAHWTPLWNALAGDVTGVARPDGLKVSEADGCLFLAQEQDLTDIHCDFGGMAPAQWRVTARVEQVGDPSIERMVARAIGKAQELARTPLRALRPESGLSTLPEIDIKGLTPLAWTLVGQMKPASTDRLLYRGAAHPTPWWIARRSGESPGFRSFQPVRAENVWKRVPVGRSRPVSLDLSTITCVNGEPLSLGSPPVMEAIDVVPEEADPLRASAQPPLDDGVCFQLVANLPAKPDEQQVRIGGLQFSIPATSRFEQRVRLVFEKEPDRPPHSLEVQTRLRISSAQPIEQDRLGGRRRRGEETNAALLIRLGDPITTAKALNLVGLETFGEALDQEVTWGFHPAEDYDLATGKLLIIDPQPFRVAAVEYGFKPDADNNELAFFARTDDGAFAWRVRDTEQTVRMLLPPQILGEAMERRVDQTGTALADIAPGEPADARFGSLTRVDFDPTWRDTATREPSWNLRRMFARIADAAPGALVRDVRFELAYGLVARHRPTEETWLAEMAGIMGSPPEALTTVKPEARRFAEQGNQLLRLADHRLAVDKLWAGRPERRFETSEALTFVLRTKAPNEGVKTKLRYPVAGGYPAPSDVPALERMRATFEDPADNGANSFAGGVSWAFESANILAEAYAQPVTTDGRISDIFFSALGGWGRQRAAFAQGKSIIETETAMGRLSIYKLERLGRIGGLGHRAKHVIVYRRTVAPSAQFYNVPPIGTKQDEHAGRPILRKCEEYVDILELERHYPERGSSTREPGCLSGARFVSRRIRVDSDWGGDVRNEGWAVPLWQADLATLTKLPHADDPDSPANLYPKPLVQLLMPSESGAEVPVAIDTPERLVFYTSTTPGETADTIDDWHAVEGIDFCDAPPPRVEPNNPSSAALHDGMLPPAPRSAGGHDPLTLGLVETQVPIQIAAGRTDTSPAATLKNVTISRAGPRAVPENSAPVGAADRAMLGALRSGNEAATLAASLRGTFDQMFGKVARRFEALAREGLGGRARAIKAVNDTRAELKADLRQLRDKLDTKAAALTNRLTEVGKLDTNVLADKLADALRATLTRQRETLTKRATGAITLAAADLVGRSRDLAARGTALSSLIDHLEKVAINDPIQDLRDRARALLETELIEALKARKTDAERFGNELDTLLQRIGPTAAKLRRLIDPQPELERLRQAIAVALSTTLAGIVAARQAVTSWTPFGSPDERDARRAELHAMTAAARRALLDITGRLQSLAAAHGIPADVKKTINGAILTLRSLEAALTSLDQEADAFPYPPAGFPALLARLDALADTLEQQVRTVGDIINGPLLVVLGSEQLLLDRFQALITELGHDVWTVIVEPVARAAEATANRIKAATQAAQAFLDAADSATAEAADAAHALAVALKGAIDQAIRQALDEVTEVIKGVEQAMLAAAKQADQDLAATIGTLVDELHVHVVNAGTVVQPVQGLADALRSQIAEELSVASTAEQEIDAQIDAFADALIATINSLADEVDEARRAIETAAADQARRLAGRLETYLGNVEQELARQLGIEPGDLVDGAAALAKDARTLYQEGDNVLRLIRAVGNPPKTDGLGFNRPEVAFVFDVLKPVVDVTPMLALANRVADTAAAIQQAGDAADKLLESFGIRLPVASLGKDLVPAGLKDLSLGKLLPDFAGLNLESLLKNAGFPDLSGKESQGVKITRGFDKVRREAWLKAEIDVKLSQSAAILDMGPIAIWIDEGQFRAESEIRIGADGRAEQEAKGQIAGDWRLVSAGIDVVTFEKTPLLFDKSGKIDFKVATDRVRLAPTLEFLTNLMAKVGQGMPAGVEPVLRGGIPVGLATHLSMQLPPIQTGAFAVTDLSLGVSFGIVAYPEFEIICSLDIASRDAPFTLAVWLLNGGGYVTQRLSYRPLARPRPILTYTLDVAILAGVGIGFGFGVVSGGVWLQVGCSVALSWTTGTAGNVTTVTAFLLARGNVDVAGLVTANIMLRLEISYDGSTLLARGTLRLSFRISMFYTLRVAQAAQYQLAGERRPDPTADYAGSFG